MGDPAKNTKASKSTAQAKPISATDFDKFKKQMADYEANTTKITKALQEEKQAHKATAEQLHQSEQQAKIAMDASDKFKQAAVEDQNTINALESRIKSLKEDLERANANTTGSALDETLEEDGITLDEAIEFVSREIPEFEDGKPTGKMTYESIHPDEVLSFKAYDDYVVVVTNAGEKIRGDK